MEPRPPTSAAASPPPGPGAAAFALVLLALLPAGIAAQVAHPLAGLLWTEPFVFLLPAVIAATGSNLEPRAWLRLRPAPPRALAAAALVGLAGWLLGSGVFAAVRAVAPASLVERFDLTRLFEGPVGERIAFALAAALVAPLCEEVAFRGHLASALHLRHRPGAAIATSALLFAALHLDPLRAPSLVLLGALYGWLAWRTGSIWPAVVAHATNNAVAAGLALWAGAADAGEAEPTLGMALALVAVGSGAAALATAAFRAAARSVPALPTPPLADPADASTRFRLSRVPRPLLVSAAVGWATLAAILLSAARSG